MTLYCWIVEFYNYKENFLDPFVGSKASLDFTIVSKYLNQQNKEIAVSMQLFDKVIMESYNYAIMQLCNVSIQEYQNSNQK